MTDRADHEATLRAAARGGDAPLAIAETALAFAALDRPRVPLDRYRDDLDMIITALRARLAKVPEDIPAADQAAWIGSVLAGELGFHGDSATYDDPRNANLMRVIDRRKGLPVALGILYIHAARGQGWQASGLNFPNHFLIRVQIADELVIIDPFNDGRIMDPADLRGLIRRVTGGKGDLPPGAIEAVPDRHVLLRLQNNIKLRLYQSDRFADALAVLERMRLLAPDQVDLRREAGMVNARLGNLGAATSLLRDYLETGGGAETERHETARLLQSLEKRLN